MVLDDQDIGDLLTLVLTAGLFVWLFWAAWMKHRRSLPVEDEKEGTSYRIYTTAFDQELYADSVPSQLPSISRDFARGHFYTSCEYWDRQIHQARMELRHVPAMDHGALASSSVAAALNDSVITLLVDHSGSMKGDAIFKTAVGVRRVADALAGTGAKLEILGFSTAGWHGGLARECWIGAKRPKWPGRLNALLHIIYKEADDAALKDDAWQVMLNPNILRENIDGEAIEWAESRLMLRPESNRLLIIISDGAPVDDSTLSENGHSYLFRHLQTVVARIETEGMIRLAAIGLNYEVSEFYSHSAFAGPSDDLSSITSGLIESVLAKNESVRPGAF